MVLRVEILSTLIKALRANVCAAGDDATALKSSAD